MTRKLLVAATVVISRCSSWRNATSPAASPELFRAQRVAIDAYVAASPVSTVLVFALIYVGVTAVSIPGATMMTLVGRRALRSGVGQLIVKFVLAMKHGLGLEKLLGTIHIYPTLPEANKYVAGEWKRNHVSPRLLALIERYHAWTRA